jgi:hypothetical protein
MTKNKETAFFRDWITFCDALREIARGQSSNPQELARAVLDERGYNWNPEIKKVQKNEKRRAA